jgi:hypothetical protein
MTISAADPIRNAAAAGRMCPVDYYYDPSTFDRAPDITAEILYVVGGLYGNAAALDTVERLAQAERAPVTIVFNGDFHWFDAEPAWFAAVEAGVSRHTAIRGNVETEIARSDDVGAGCGCAYPESVSNETVARSNTILRELRPVTGEAGARLAALAMHRVAQIGRLRVGIVHGDAVALAGWRFDAAALDHSATRWWLADIQEQAKVDVFASTHTCAAALRDFALPSGTLTVINNGSAGMANFSGSTFGLLSRIATSPSPHAPVYGTVRGGVFIDAIPIRFDMADFLGRFLARWPAGSAAHMSCFQRIMEGPDHTVAVAQPQR